MSDSTKPSRLTRGTDFEHRIVQLLRSSTGYKNVQEQQHILGKNVDIIFQKQWNPHKFITIAVECKNWQSGLTRDVVKGIYFDHQPLFDQNKIDELWIVTPLPLSPTVTEFVRSLKGVEVLHLNELEQDIIDFTLYANHLKSRFRDGNFSQLYIPARVEGASTHFHLEVLRWLKSPNSAPMAVWGGYGMGKTSYATFLASELAADYLTDSSKRIPIYVPMGDYYTAPRLDGLFANVLTRDNGVHGYNFYTFWNLHEAGRFVIILDGFDEMKHAMTSAEFYSISKEIRSLILEKSKVILLGRPDALVSGEEHDLLLKGTRTMAQLKIPEPPQIEFKEYRLDFFDANEYMSFIKKYIDCFYKGSNKSEFVKNRLDDINKVSLADILKRPVQAKMLAQVLLNPNNKIEAIGKYDLYDTFISDCLTREEEKHQRQKTKSDVRRAFMQDLAWWLWTVKRTRTFTPQDVPNSLTQKFLDTSQDVTARLRELLVGSVLEEQTIGSIVTEKSAGTFYFPHLSFTEFLVVEYVAERKLSERDIEILIASLDGEISGFLLSYGKRDALFKLFTDLSDYRLRINWSFIELLTASQAIRETALRFSAHNLTKSLLSEISKISVWQQAVIILTLMQVGHSKGAVARCMDAIGRADTQDTIVAVQLLIKMAIEDPSERRLFTTSLLYSIGRGLKIPKLFDDAGRLITEYTTSDNIEEFFVKLASCISFWGPSKVFYCDLSVLYRTVRGITGSFADEDELSVHHTEIPSSEVRVLFVDESVKVFDRWVNELELIGGRHSLVQPRAT